MSSRRAPAVMVVAGFALFSLAVAKLTGANEFGGLPDLLRGLAATLVLWLVAGDALAVSFCPEPLRPVRPLLALPLGATASALVMTALGFAWVPLEASLVVVLAGGVAASVRVRRGRPRRPARLDGPALAAWLAVLGLVLAVVLIPAWRFDTATVFGENPDAHQVTGIAELFKQAHPLASRPELPVDEVPSSWAFRYPIFYTLAGASTLAGLDPIKAFPAVSSLLVLLAATGFGLLAAFALRLPPLGGVVVGGAAALNVTTIHLAVHPYYNQLWGLALLPWILLFGWLAVRGRDPVALGPFGAVALLAALAYPLAIPYPLAFVAALAVAHRLSPRGWVRLRRRPRPLAAAGLALLGMALLVPIVGAADKLRQGLGQLVDLDSPLWMGDKTEFVPPAEFVSVPGPVAAVAVVLIAVVSAWRLLERREAVAVLAVLAGLGLLTLRFRLSDFGPYMDFKHLTTVGALVVVLMAAGAVAAVASRRPAGIAVGLLVLSAWGTGTVFAARDEFGITGRQVTPELLELVEWSDELPPEATIRLDLAPTGRQLWAQYLLADRRLVASTPVLNTTYAHAPFGLRADLSLAFRCRDPGALGPDCAAAAPPPWTYGPPVRSNAMFVLRRIRVPAKWAALPDVASQRMVQP